MVPKTTPRKAPQQNGHANEGFSSFGACLHGNLRVNLPFGRA
jgi:hypothetical protein